MIDCVRRKNPLIHCMTNNVVTNFTANGLLAIGASPVMTVNHEEVEEMAETADGLLLNTGTLTPYQHDAMLIAGRSANAHQTPIVLDPVAVGATAYRTKMVKMLLEDIHVSAIRGNGGEIASLIGMNADMHGVEGQSDQNPDTLAREAANELDTVICVTGEIDAVSDGERTYLIKKGHEWLSRVVGTGCLLGAVIAAYVASQEQDETIAHGVAAAVADYGIAAEEAFTHAKNDGIGSFQQRFLDALGGMNNDNRNRKAVL